MPEPNSSMMKALFFLVENAYEPMLDGVLDQGREYDPDMSSEDFKELFSGVEALLRLLAASMDTRTGYLLMARKLEALRKEYSQASAVLTRKE